VTLTHGTGLPIAGMTGLGSGVSSALAASVTGSGGIVLGTSPTISGPTITGGTISGLSSPIPVASGGTNSASASGTALDNIAGFSGTGLLLRTGAGAYSFQAPGAGVQTALGVAANASGGIPLVNGSVTSGDCMQWSASGVQDSGSACYDTKVVNVTSYGAVGNSNGTHGNGTDNTTAFQNAMNAASGGSLFIPCGTYRLTATITVTDGKPRYIYGHGTCTKIFNDATTAQPTFSASPSSGTCSSAQLAPCWAMQGLNFLPPNLATGAQSAIFLTNTNAPLFSGNTFNGQNVGISLVTSFAPRVIGNQFIGGSYGFYSTDISPNGAEIASNGFYGLAADAVYIAPASGCAESPSIRNNDFEDNGAAVIFGGVCGSSFANNYEENLHTQVPFVFTGTTNAALSFTGNTINSSDTTPVTVSIAHAAGIVFSGNDILNTVFSYGAGATLGRIRAIENTLSSTTLPSASAACTGLGTGGSCVVTGDDFSGTIALNTGSASTSVSGAITLTFTNAIGINGSSCTWTPIAGTANWSSASFLVSSASTTSNQVTWTNSANLTASKVYLLGYSCQGY
jgi:parallel beta-helix repeat protein